MGAETNLLRCIQEIIRAICEEDLERTLEQFDPEGSFHDPTGRWEGLDALRNFFTVAFAAVEDIRWTVHRTVVQGDKLAFDWAFGYRVVMGPCSGKTATWDGITIMELRNGKIWRYRDYWDSLDPLSQLGVRSWEEAMGGDARLRESSWDPSPCPALPLRSDPVREKREVALEEVDDRHADRDAKGHHPQRASALLRIGLVDLGQA